MPRPSVSSLSFSSFFQVLFPRPSRCAGVRAWFVRVLPTEGISLRRVCAPPPGRMRFGCLIASRDKQYVVLPRAGAAAGWIL